MNDDYLKDVLEKVRVGELSADDALDRLRTLPFEELGYAKVDHHRCLRQGVPEVIFSEGKTPTQIREIAKRLAKVNTNVLATRADVAAYEAVREAVDCRYYEQARIIVINPVDIEKIGEIAVVSAGTSDVPVAEEAAVTAETLGNLVNRVYDVGVSGVHRLLFHFDELSKANVIVVVAGMEGALAGVVGGLARAPVIAVPTSVGYGAAFGGLAALLAMLNTCASGVSVVNIDNGFGAGFQAGLINKLATNGGPKSGGRP